MPKQVDTEEDFLISYSHSAIESTIHLATVITKNNPFIVTTSLLFYLSHTIFISSFSLWFNVEEELIFSFSILGIVLFSIFLFSYSNIIYIGKILKKSTTLTKLVQHTKTIKLADFYFQFIFIALGFLIAMFCIILAFGILYFFKDTYSLIFYIPVGLVLFLFLYLQPLLFHSLIISSTFKDGYKALFQIFNLSFIKKSFSSDYFYFIFIGSFLVHLVSKISDWPAKIISKNEESMSFIITDSIFITLYTFFISILIFSIASILSHYLIQDTDKTLT